MQVNFWFPQQQGEHPFLNHLKVGTAWVRFSNNRYFDQPDLLDSNGYPTALPTSGNAGALYSTFFIPPQTKRPGRYVITADGDGSLGLAIGATGATGSLTASGGSLRYEFLPGGDHPTLYNVTRGASDYMRNIRFFHVDDETLINSGKQFGVQFKQKLIDGGATCLRFMDWQYHNITQVSQLSELAPVGMYTYGDGMPLAGTWAGDTTNSGNAYTATLPGFTLTDKAKLHLRWNASATGSGVTLRVNSGSFISVRNSYGDVLSVSPTSEYPGATKMSTLVYDASLNVWLKKGGDDNQGDMPGFHRGVPLQVLMDLCNELTTESGHPVHPWFNIPVLACDPLTAYAADLATACAAGLNAGIRPHIEPPNELWNHQFPATHYAEAKEIARGYGDSYFHQWYGRTSARIGKAIWPVFSNDTSKFEFICGCQVTYYPPSASEERLTSSGYVAETSDSTNAAYHYFTAMSPSCYWNAAQNLDATGRQSAAVAFVAADAAGKQTILDGIINSPSMDVLPNGNFAQYAGYMALGATYGVNKLLPYEGGLSTDEWLATTEQIAVASAMRLDAKALVNQTLRNWYDVALYNGVPSVYQFAGDSAWAAMFSVYDADTPQWTAAKLFKAGKRRLRLKAA